MATANIYCHFTFSKSIGPRTDRMKTKIYKRKHERNENTKNSQKVHKVPKLPKGPMPDVHECC